MPIPISTLPPKSVPKSTVGPRSALVFASTVRAGGGGFATVVLSSAYQGVTEAGLDLLTGDAVAGQIAAGYTSVELTNEELDADRLPETAEPLRYVLTGLQVATAYCARVSAWNDMGWSPPQTSLPVGLALGQVTLPPLPYYGVEGGRYMHLMIEAFMIFPASRTGGLMIMYTFKANDPDTLGAFPYAADALSHYFTIQLF